MTTTPGARAAARMVGILLLAALPTSAGARQPQVAYIDAHGHLTPRSPCDATASAAIALSLMESLGIRQTLILSPPEDTGAGCQDDGHLASPINPISALPPTIPSSCS